MPAFVSDTGGLDDRVRLVLNGEEIVIAESYSVRASVFEQPEGFSIRMGWGRVARDLIRKYPANTPFALRIGNVLTQTGFTDGFEAATDPATELTIDGRDVLQRLYDDHIGVEKSYKDATYSDLVRKQMADVGLDPALLLTNPTADRQIRAGVPLVELAPSVFVDEVVTDASGQSTTGTIQQAIKNHIGERRLMFIRRYLDRAGLFIRSSSDGKVVLFRPNAQQKPVARIIRRRDTDTGVGNVIGARYRNSARERFSEAIVFGRGHGGRRSGRPKSKGAFTDDAMIDTVANGGDVAAPYAKRVVIRDANVQSPAQAEFLAARKLAEGRRAGWTLTYRMSGHTTPALGSKARCVWTPDTIVDVIDEEYGIAEPMYVEACEYTRNPQTETVIKLLRPADLIFGPEE